MVQIQEYSVLHHSVLYGQLVEVLVVFILEAMSVSNYGRGGGSGGGGSLRPASDPATGGLGMLEDILHAEGNNGGGSQHAQELRVLVVVAVVQVVQVEMLATPAVGAGAWWHRNFNHYYRIKYCDMLAVAVAQEAFSAGRRSSDGAVLGCCWAANTD
jgi:hypothetical protein